MFSQGIDTDSPPPKRKRESSADGYVNSSRMKKVTCMEHVEYGVRPYVFLEQYNSDLTGIVAKMQSVFLAQKNISHVDILVIITGYQPIFLNR